MTDTKLKYLPKPRHGYGTFTSAFVNERQCFSVISFFANTFVCPKSTPVPGGDKNREKLQEIDISAK